MLVAFEAVRAVFIFWEVVLWASQHSQVFAR
jgi:hypothetical protein